MKNYHFTWAKNWRLGGLKRLFRLRKRWGSGEITVLCRCVQIGPLILVKWHKDYRDQL